MTTEKAIQLLHRLQDEQFDGIYGDERREALEMAVRALSSQQTDTDSQGLVNDCISRQAAIVTAVRTAIDWHRLANPQYSIAYCIGEAMRQLPSAQPQRKKGKWKDIPHTFLCQCSVCHWVNDYTSGFNFCPNCGAKMDGGESE